MIVEIKGISKSFPGVKALENVNLDLRKGEIHALVGENGAGKTTLMNILRGILKPDEGFIKVNGKKINKYSPKNSLELGISMIYQEINLLSTLSVAENIFIEQLPRIKKYPFVNWKKLYEKTERVLKEVGLDINPTKKVSELSVGQQQMVQLSKAISRNAKIIIMDEPTASISEAETEKLFEVLKKFKSEKKSIFYISHRLEEIFQIADRVTVLRNGKYIDTLNVSETDKDQIISRMVGRYIEEIFEKRESEKGNVILEVKGLSKKGMFNNISFSLKEGEVLGLYGLVGAGRTELALSLLGVYQKDLGEIILNNHEVEIKSPNDAIKKGIGYLSEDRKDKSLFPVMNVMENITISSLPKYSNFNFIDNKKEIEESKKYIDRLNIKTSSIKQKISNLSGGNQQKIVISRILALGPRIMILDEPTTGIDVGARVEIHSLVTFLAKNKIGILFISSDLPEINNIADRVLVMREGKISGIFLGLGKTRQELILKAASPV